MAASNTDRFKKSKRKFETTVGVGGILAGGTTLPLTSVTGLDTSTAVTLVVGAGTATEEVITGVVSGSDLINCVRGKEGTTDSAHSAGETVNMFFTETHWDDMVDGILVSHDQDGTLKDGAVDAASVLASNVVTTAKIADDAVTAAKLDGVDKSLLSTDSNPYKFSAYRSTAWTASAALTKVQLNAETFDTNNNFDSTTNYRYNVPVSGFYQFNANITISGNTNRVFVAIYKNGSGGTELARNDTNISNAIAVPYSAAVSVLAQLTAGEYVELFHASSAVAGSTGAGVTHMSGFLVSRT